MHLTHHVTWTSGSMYAKRLQITSYGPIRHLDIAFPFDGDTPKPLVLVGANGAGKSIFLSFIVNGLVSAKDSVYPDTPEVATERVFKLRSQSYIRLGSEAYFGRADFEEDIFIGEIAMRKLKREYEQMPLDTTSGDAEATWRKMDTDIGQKMDSNIWEHRSAIRDLFSRNCALYFPHNRFEEPAWLNEASLESQAKHIRPKHLERHTERTLISYSPLPDNQDWLFDIIFDQRVFEAQTTPYVLPADGGGRTRAVQAFSGYSGRATNAYNTALDVVAHIVQDSTNVRFGIGQRNSRHVSLMGASGALVPNIFQLSSGQTSLLNIFLSILRDFELSGAQFSNAGDVRGIVVVDEIDLHLHATHQHEVLPGLIKMFPQVQFIITTHSPLFVLGMQNAFGEDGFALYRLPQGDQISPEEFGEFTNAYQAFAATRTFADEVRNEIKAAARPIVYMEGTTDIQYLRRASKLLGDEALLDRIEPLDGKGGGLRKIWSAISKLPDELVPRTVVVLHDCDYTGEPQTEGKRAKRRIPRQEGHPIEKGIENLFSKATLQKALQHKTALIDISAEYPETRRGEVHVVPEKWTVNDDEKKNLCDWICENGTAEDFASFTVVFDLLKDAVEIDDA